MSNGINSTPNLLATRNDIIDAITSYVTYFTISGLIRTVRVCKVWNNRFTATKAYKKIIIFKRFYQPIFKRLVISLAQIDNSNAPKQGLCIARYDFSFRRYHHREFDMGTPVYEVMPITQTQYQLDMLSKAAQVAISESIITTVGDDKIHLLPLVNNSSKMVALINKARELCERCYMYQLPNNILNCTLDDFSINKSINYNQYFNEKSVGAFLDESKLHSNNFNFIMDLANEYKLLPRNDSYFTFVMNNIPVLIVYLSVFVYLTLEFGFQYALITLPCVLPILLVYC